MHRALKSGNAQIFIPQKLQTQQAETQASKGKDDEPPPPPFAGLKLKPKRPVQRKPIEEPKQDTPFKVELKHWIKTNMPISEDNIDPWPGIDADGPEPTNTARS